MLNKFQNLFRNIVAHVENRPYPFWQYILLFIAILAIRLCLEFFSSTRRFQADDIIQIGMWFTVIVLCFILTLTIASGENIMKVSRLVIPFFSIALSAPILDLILTKGQGAKMNFLTINSWNEIPWQYFTLGGSAMNRGATLGIRIEVGLLLLVTCNYVYQKRRSVLAGILAAISLYSILFFFAIVPTLLIAINSLAGFRFTHGDQSTQLFLLFFLVLFSGVFLFLNDAKPAWRALKKIPWLIFASGLLAMTQGALFARMDYPGNWEINPTTLYYFPFLFIIALLMITTATIANENQTSGVLLSACAIFISGIISYKLLFMSSVAFGLVFLLYYPPLLLHKAPILNRVMESLLIVVAGLTGYSCFGGVMISFPSWWILYLTLLGTGTGFIMDAFIKGSYVIPWPDALGKNGKWFIAFTGAACIIFGITKMLMDEAASPATILTGISLVIFHLVLKFLQRKADVKNSGH